MLEILIVTKHLPVKVGCNFVVVAGPGLEPGLRGYEPRELPLLNPAIEICVIMIFFITH